MDKGKGGKTMQIVLLLVYILCSATGLILIKMGSQGMSVQMSQGIFSISANVRLLVGMLFYICSFLLFIFVVSKFELSYIYPLSTGIITVCSVLAGVWLLGEKLQPVNAAGVAVVIVGIVLMNIKR